MLDTVIHFVTRRYCRVVLSLVLIVLLQTHLSLSRSGVLPSGLTISMVAIYGAHHPIRVVISLGFSIWCRVWPLARAVWRSLCPRAFCSEVSRMARFARSWYRATLLRLWLHWEINSSMAPNYRLASLSSVVSSLQSTLPVC